MNVSAVTTTLKAKVHALCAQADELNKAQKHQLKRFQDHLDENAKVEGINWLARQCTHNNKGLAEKIQTTLKKAG